MKDNMLVFNDNETHTEIRYVIAHFEKSRWYHYLDFQNIDDAKSVIMQTLDNEILVDTLHLRLEQLKERNKE